MKKISLLVLMFVLAITVTQAQVPGYVPTNGLVGWWPFNGNANDESGNGNNGVVTGATLATDRFGISAKSYYFNGTTSNYITVTNSPSININGSQLTLSCWIYTEDSCLSYGHKGISKGGWDVGNGYELVYGNGCSGVQLSGGYGGLQTINPIKNGNWNKKWTHIVAVFNNGSGTIYTDGVIEPSSLNGVQFTSFISTTAPLYFGKRSPGNSMIGYVKGKMDDIGIWNRALSAQEIIGLYQGNNPCPPVSSIQGPATITVGSSAQFTDSTANGNWLISNSSIASIDSTGFVTALSSGAVSVYYIVNTSCGPDTAIFNLQILSPSNCLPAYVPTNGLVGWWPFCGNANDESGNGHNGTTHGVILTNDRFGVVNSAFNFGNLKYISVNYDTALSCSKALSISVWARAFQVNTQPFSAVLQKSNTDFQGFGDYNVNLITQGPRLGYTSNNNSTSAFNTSNSIQDSQWCHIVTSWNGALQNIYVNGVLKYSGSYNSILNDGHLELDFGANLDGSDEYFDGDIDDIGIWNRALDSVEVYQLYNTSSPTSVNNLSHSGLIYYPCPVSTTLFINNPTEFRELHILKIDGQLIENKKLNLGENNIDVTNLTDGLYLLNIGSKMYKLSVSH